MRLSILAAALAAALFLQGAWGLEVQRGGTWPRIGMAEPYISLLGWRGDTAVVWQVTYACCVVDSTEELLLVSADTVIARLPDSAAVPETEPGRVISNRSTQLDGTASVWLEMAVDGDELEAMYESCREFERYMDSGPPPVHAELAAVDGEGRVLWSAQRSLGWIAGECGPLFDLPRLELSATSPDSAVVYLCIFYGEAMEHFVVPLSGGSNPGQGRLSSLRTCGALSGAGLRR